jgi:hypothetical protein
MRSLLLTLSVVLPVLAQPPVARLEGIVEDPAGAAVNKAAITAESRQTAFRASVLSDDRGFYVFPSLPPGDYTLTVWAAGFQTAKVSGMVLNVSMTTNMPVRLAIGSITETIKVEAKEATVQLADAQGGGVIARSDIDLLPLYSSPACK